MTKHSSDEPDPLAPFFAAARRDAPDPTPAFLDQLADQAEAAVADMQRPVMTARPSLIHLLGGWSGLGGLVTAGAAGVWIGVAPPAGLPDPGSYWIAQDTSALLYDDWVAFSDQLTEGVNGDE